MIGFWLKALTRPTLDLTLATHAGQETRIVERPGAVLDDEALGALVEKLRGIASRTLDKGALTYGVFSGERERLAQTVLTLITDKASGQAIAFNALAEMKIPLDGDTQTVTHLGLVMVDPEARGRGLSWVLYGLTVLVLFVRGGLRPPDQMTETAIMMSTLNMMTAAGKTRRAARSAERLLLLGDTIRSNAFVWQ